MSKQANNTATIEFPLSGIDLSNPFDLQPPGTTPEGINCRAFEPGTLRARGGSRAGLERYLGVLPTGSVIQNLEFIVDPQEDALTADYAGEPLAPFGVEYIDDPSSNNFVSRNPSGLSGTTPRRVRKGGSGFAPNRHIPAGVGSKKTPVITWAAVGTVDYGNTFDGFKNAVATDPVTSAPVAGSFVYTTDGGTYQTFPAVGSHTLVATFTPTDSAAYYTNHDTQTATVAEVPSPYATGHGTASNAATAITDSVGATSVTMAINGAPEAAYANVSCVHADENTGPYGNDLPFNGAAIGIEWFASTPGGTFPDGGNFFWSFVAS